MVQDSMKRRSVLQMQSDSTTDYKKDKVNREKFKITSLGNSNFKTFNQTHVSQTLYV